MKTDAYNSFLEETWRPAETESIFTALELGLFDDIENGFNTPELLSNERNYHLPTIQSIFKLLRNMEFLAEVDGFYSINEKYKSYILKASPLYNGDIWLLHKKLNRDLWKHLKMKAEKGEEAVDVFATKDSQVWQSAMPFLNSLAKISSESLVNQLEDDLLKEDNQRILDLGCGTGIYSATLLNANETWQGTGVDIESVIEIARDNNQELLAQNRIDFCVGDIFEKHEEIGNVDVVILSNVMHGYGDEQNRNLLKTAGSYLKPGGKVIVNEFLLPDSTDNVEYIFDLFFSMVGTGSSFTKEHLNTLFLDTGFKEEEEIILNGPSTCLVFTKD